MTKQEYQNIADKRDIKLFNISCDRDFPSDLLIAAEDNYRTDKSVIDILMGSTIL